MPLIGVFLITFAVVFIVTKTRGASRLDSLHRAAVSAIIITLLFLAAAITFNNMSK